jgi:hypothetical protein
MGAEHRGDLVGDIPHRSCGKGVNQGNDREPEDNGDGQEDASFFFAA